MTTSDVVSQLRPVAAGLFSTSPPQLTGGRCRHCAALHFPQRELCPECQRDHVESVALSRTGTVYTFTIVRMAPPGYRGEAPYAYGLVELPEGLRVTTTLVADDLEAIEIGGPCSFTLLELGTGEDRVLSYAYRIGDAQ